MKLEELGWNSFFHKQNKENVAKIFGTQQAIAEFNTDPPSLIISLGLMPLFTTSTMALKWTSQYPDLRHDKH